MKTILLEKNDYFSILKQVPKLVITYSKTRSMARKQKINKDTIKKHDTRVKKSMMKYSKIKNNKKLKESYILLHEGMFSDIIREIVNGIMRAISSLSILILSAVCSLPPLIFGGAFGVIFSVLSSALFYAFIGYNIFNMFYTVYRIFMVGASTIGSSYGSSSFTPFSMKLKVKQLMSKSLSVVKPLKNEISDPELKTDVNDKINNYQMMIHQL